jgi:nucleoid-associated protein YgaU
MPEMICPQCGYRESTPADATRCPRCNAAWPVEGDNARLYYQQAGELAAAGKDADALAVVRQGLSRYDTPDLHLLAAILCRRMGDLNAMRQHVAAIPVDDALREEAEWLLRSQSPVSAEATGARYRVEDPELAALLAPAPAAPTNVHVRRRGRWLAVAAILALCAGTAWAWIAFAPSGDMADALPTPPSIAATVTAPTDQATVEQANDAPTAPDLTPAPTSSPLLLPTPTIPPNFVQVPSAPEQLAAADEANAAAAATQFDLAAYLEELGNPELAALNVAARLDAQELALTGYVETFTQREQIIALTEVVPGIESVTAAELYVRPPSTYTVAAGDSLWSITYSIYGDMARMEDIYNANRDVMASPESLKIGMVLKLPPFE